MNTTVAIDVAVPDFSVHVDCALAPGITAMAGPSGSGKSLTLAAIAGLVAPQSGHIELFGVPVFDADEGLHVRSQDRGIGMVFQLPALLHHRSPLDNVALGVVNEKRHVRREIALRWLKRVGAEHLAEKNTRQLSGGERQRISLARALAGGCRLLLLDEPFSALDRDSRYQLRQLVIDIVRQENLTAVIVSHDIDDIAEMANSVVLFEPGSTVGQFTVDPSSPDSVLKILGHRS